MSASVMVGWRREWSIILAICGREMRIVGGFVVEVEVEVEAIVACSTGRRCWGVRDGRDGGERMEERVDEVVWNCTEYGGAFGSFRSHVYVGQVCQDAGFLLSSRGRHHDSMKVSMKSWCSH